MVKRPRTDYKDAQASFKIGVTNRNRIEMAETIVVCGVTVASMTAM